MDIEELDDARPEHGPRTMNQLMDRTLPMDVVRGGRRFRGHMAIPEVDGLPEAERFVMCDTASAFAGLVADCPLHGASVLQHDSFIQN